MDVFLNMLNIALIDDLQLYRYQCIISYIAQQQYYRKHWENTNCYYKQQYRIVLQTYLKSDSKTTDPNGASGGFILNSSAKQAQWYYIKKRL